jgi:hypothetical protein
MPKNTDTIETKIKSNIDFIQSITDNAPIAVAIVPMIPVSKKTVE